MKNICFERVEFGMHFVIIRDANKPDAIGKFEKDLNAVCDIFAKGIENLTAFDRARLLQIYKVAYHESGKIEGIYSLDSSATNCNFCIKMRKAAETNPDLVCGFCYDFKQEKYRKAVLNRHSLNLLIMSKVEFTVEELSMLSGIGLARVNSSGDAENVIYAKNMLRYAIAHEHAKVAIWSKNVLAYIKAIDEIGKPGNVILIQSSPFINRPVARAKYFDYVFTVYSDENAVRAAIEAGACECNGKKCRDCGYNCYFGNWEPGANIAEYLRK